MITLHAALLALALQAPPAAAPQAAPKAAVSGVVVNANGEPLANVRVTLGKLNVNLGLFTQFVLGDHPPRETTISAEALVTLGEAIASEMENGGIPPEERRQADAFRSVPVDEIYELTITPTGSMSVVYKSTPPVMTDERGRFSFNAVDAGTYKLTFSASGFAKIDFGQRTAATGGVPLTLTAGQSKSDIVMRMQAVGAVSGRLRDSLGQPAAGVPVQLFRFAYDETGKRTVQRVTVTRTNDLGEYRMYYLTPGQYYLNAGTPPGTSTNLPDYILFGGYNTQNRIQQNYAVTYYPGVAKEIDAVPIEVQSGADLRGLDLFVSPITSYKIRGRVVDSRTGQPPQSVSLSMVAQNLDPSGPISTGVGNPNYKAADGSFELQNVNPGAFVLSASLPRPSQNAPIDFNSMSPAERTEYFRVQQAEELLRPKASAPITVVNSDLDGVVLSLGLNGSAQGRVRMETDPGKAAPSSDFLRVLVKSTAPTSFLDSGPQSRPVANDGTFRVDNIKPGDYRVGIAGMPEGFYLKEARIADTDILAAPFRYVSGETPVLDILLSPKVGSLEGTTDPGAQVVLIPSRNRDRTELFRPVTADSSGHFAIPNVAPGDYTLAAWEALEPYAFFDPNRIRQAEGAGKAVQVAESASVTISVTPIK